ncbi:hypothetical protein BOTBODRAFT_118640 [Botryobasidium botryosum FD-172 SS1]|uniref:Major facilitator superfamily (MFS) profile domain-containing protein n=1 Tax=Botryobasidium botryosum (strain FD-172 SS1) TaxID=930990 RepID=A0A067LZ11_BOTB1|nr:hypothetical protein BOTBODRAFT_118640 [Botryobasidium botryosum FD-172 SS1]
MPWKGRIRLIASLLLPIFLETLDYTIVATSQSEIASAFNNLTQQSWIGTSYILASTVFLPVYASVTDIFGRHWALQQALLIFLVGSAICTGAQNMPMLLTGRGIAGVGAAGMVTVTRIIFSDSTSLEDNNWQSAVMTVLYAIGYVCGPLIGGALSSINWRWIFAINLPGAVVGSLLVFLLLRSQVKPAQPPRRLPSDALSTPYKESFLEKINRVDWLGVVLFTIACVGILLGLNWGSSSGWGTLKVILSLCVGGAVMVAFIIWEHLLERYETGKREPPRVLATTEPMIPITLFRSYDVVATSFAALSSGMLMFGCFYFLSIYFIIVVGQSATKAGTQLLSFAPGLGIGVAISTRIISRTKQPKYAIILGSILQPIGIGFLSKALMNDNQSQVNIFLGLCGASVGLTFGPLSMHARFTQPENRIATIVALNLFFRTEGGTVGLAQLSAVLNSKVRTYLSNTISSGSLSPADAATLAGESLDSVSSMANLPPQLLQIVRDAFRDGVRWAFISLIPWSCVALLAVLFLSTTKQSTLVRMEASSAGEAAEPPAHEGGAYNFRPVNSHTYPPSYQDARMGPDPRYGRTNYISPSAYPGYPNRTYASPVAIPAYPATRRS